ncbi:MAG: zinc ABC transporter substrate-binding protein [Corynebacterium casei]|nr:zinc ABC transporter substrate-binding protein [Corynebacterium casei]
MHLQTSPNSSRTHRGRRAALAALSVGALAFVSACSTATSDEASDYGSEGGNDTDTLNIVASTSIWGDVAQSIADSAEGVDVEVTSIVEGNNMDPHHFEPTAADLARAGEADVIVGGGGGYDAWLYDAIEDQDKIIHALPLTAHSHDHGDEEGHDHDHDHDHDHGEEGHSHDVSSIDGNEHIWYDPTAVMEVAHEIAEQINEVNPDAQASDEEVVSLVSDLDSRLHALPKVTYTQTEPIADYMLAHTDMTDATPEGYRHATLSHGEPAAADLAAFIDELKAGDVDVLIYNPQTQTDMTSRIRTTAEDEGIQVVEIGETPPDNQNFFEYFEEVVSSLEALEV